MVPSFKLKRPNLIFLLARVVASLKDKIKLLAILRIRNKEEKKINEKALRY